MDIDGLQDVAHEWNDFTQVAITAQLISNVPVFLPQERYPSNWF
jgi:hypothetical protein